MAGSVINKTNWEGWIEDDGHRYYSITWEVISLFTDGPQTVFASAGLPTIGSPWTFGNDNDLYALCQPTMRCRPMVTKEPNHYWEVEQTFSTKPLNRCFTGSVETPLTEPQRVSGSFIHLTKKWEKDREGKLILSSSHEPIFIEKRCSNPTVRIEQNVLDLDLEIVAPMINTLNDATLWGLSARKILLSDFSWEQAWYDQCSPYYVRRFEFEIKYEGWDEAELADTGLKVLNGRWVRDEDGKLEWVTYAFTSEEKENPANFVRWLDANGQPMPRSLLNGAGEPLTDPETPEYLDPKEIYDESNFTLLGIPTGL